MKWKMISAALCVAFLLAPSTPGQEAPVSQKIASAPGSSNEASQAGRMYEDIEVMRRLLNGKLQAFAPPSTTHLFSSPYVQRSLLFTTPSDGIYTLDPLAVYNTIDPNAYSGAVNRLLFARQNVDLTRKGAWFRSFHRPLTVASTAPSIFAEGT